MEHIGLRTTEFEIQGQRPQSCDSTKLELTLFLSAWNQYNGCFAPTVQFFGSPGLPVAGSSPHLLATLAGPIFLAVGFELVILHLNPFMYICSPPASGAWIQNQAQWQTPLVHAGMFSGTWNSVSLSSPKVVC